MTATGAYTLIVGDSASWPVPESGLVSMEQAALLMMQRVLDAESNGLKRVFAFVLGPVASRLVSVGAVSADQVGAVAIAASASSRAAGQIVALHGNAEGDEALARLGLA